MTKTIVQESLPRDSEKGFSLIDVLLAIVILSLGLLATAKMQTWSTNSIRKGYHLTEAGVQGMDLVERLLANPYDHADLDADPGVNPHTAVEGQYNISWTVTEDTPIDNLKTIDIDVSWQEGADTRTMSFTYFKMRS